MDKFDRAFGHGISGGFAIAVNRRDEVAPLVRKLRAADEGKPERARLFSRITTLDDRLPADQQDKLEVLDDLRRLVDRQLRHPDTLSDADRKALAESRPPEGCARSATPTCRWSSPGPTSNGTVRAGGSSWPTAASASTPGTPAICGGSRPRCGALGLGPDVLVGGSAFVFSDMLAAMERDGPRATLIAALGAVVVVAALLGPSLAAFATLFCGAFGTLAPDRPGWALPAQGELPRLRVAADHHRHRRSTIRSTSLTAPAREPDTPQGRIESARTASAVALCSYTTVVGYGSLWFSANKGIQSFGFAAMLGEVDLPQRRAS